MAEVKRNQYRDWLRLSFRVLIPLVLFTGAIGYWRSLQDKVSTDNAYIKMDMVSVSSEVGGQIVEVPIGNSKHVNAGDLLFRVDPEPFQLKVLQADAGISEAQASQVALAKSSALSGADLEAAREKIEFAQKNLARQEALWSKGFTTKAAYEDAKHKVAVAQEQLRIAQANAREAAAKLSSGSQLPGIFPPIAAARAQRNAAQLSLRKTEVRAPISGTVSQAERLRVGQQLIPGLPVLTLVMDNTAYIDAKFKETDLDDLRVGQPAEIRIDAFPGLALKGHIASIGAGTEGEFSILPAQNATGNWVKVSQRVSVRIVFDEPCSCRLVAGLSVRATVFTSAPKN